MTQLPPPAANGMTPCRTFNYQAQGYGDKSRRVGGNQPSRSLPEPQITDHPPK